MDHAVAIFDKVGDDLDFTVGAASMPEPGPDEVRFKVAAFALNQADLLLTQGRHYVTSDLPIRLGYEGCGTVDAVGVNVTRFKPGDKVSSIPNVDGPYWTGGEYALAKESFLVGWPEGWSAAQATSFLMQYLTPYYPLAERFRFEPGAWVMITAATGGTGLGTIRLAKMLGARIIATTRSEEKISVLRANGADVVLSTDQADFVERVMEATEGNGVDLINDSLCGSYVAMLSETLAFGGIMYIHGGLSGDNNFTMNVLNLVHRQAGIHGYSLINELRIPGALERGCKFLLDHIAKGDLAPPTIDSVYPLAQVAEAYRRMQSGKQVGKIVVTVSE
ncbi:MAG: zinc-dependent alcohol dehydrogenase family protein [Thermomicrobiales bacterium]